MGSRMSMITAIRQHGVTLLAILSKTEFLLSFRLVSLGYLLFLIWLKSRVYDRVNRLTAVWILEFFGQLVVCSPKHQSWSELSLSWEVDGLAISGLKRQTFRVVMAIKRKSVCVIFSEGSGFCQGNQLDIVIDHGCIRSFLYLEIKTDLLT